MPSRTRCEPLVQRQEVYAEAWVGPHQFNTGRQEIRRRTGKLIIGWRLAGVDSVDLSNVPLGLVVPLRSTLTLITRKTSYSGTLLADGTRLLCGSGG